MHKKTKTKPKTKKAPNGSHYMENGKLMKDSAMKKGKKKSSKGKKKSSKKKPAVKRARGSY